MPCGASPAAPAEPAVVWLSLTFT